MFPEWLRKWLGLYPLTAEQQDHVCEFLSALQANNGFLADGEAALEDNGWAAALSVRHGYAYAGSGWNAGVSITRKGIALLSSRG